ncbi:MAG: hypothetical protein JRC90_04910 [Deltaproteobacteria bacterium]|nr:hypothetical protein [Deltaproteobacteria bacterium]
MRGEKTMKFSLKFWIGIVLLTTNQPLGWGAMLACDAIAINKQDEFFFYLGIALYALSWGMLGLGALLAGPEGIRYSRLLLKKAWRRFALLFRGGKSKE